MLGMNAVGAGVLRLHQCGGLSSAQMYRGYAQYRKFFAVGLTQTMQAERR